MSRQTDELLLHNTVESEPEVVTPAIDVGRIRERLHILQSFKNHPGYSVLIESLKYEAQHCLVAMDKAETPTAITKASANYYTLMQVLGYVDREIAQLTALLSK
jgi:hypothetical protein